MSTTTHAPIATPTVSPETFRRDLNRKAIPFTHTLPDNPLFDLERLGRLATVLPKSDVYVSTGKNKAATDFNAATMPDLAAPDAISNIAANGTRVLLKRVEKDPAYKALLDECLESFLPYCEPGFKDTIRSIESFIFITAPKCITPYHMDPEMGFFFQVRGDKFYNLFDTSVVSVEEAETYYRRIRGDFTVLKFREEMQKDAQVLNLKGGTGFIQPVNAPHWVGTGDEVSISYTFAIETKAIQTRAASMMVNRYLRKAGLNPRPYGKSAPVDSMKLAFLDSLHLLRKVKRRFK